MDYGVYRDGIRDDADGTLAGCHRLANETGGFVWIGLHEPTAEEFDAASVEFDLHELLVEDALKAHQRAKVEQYDDVFFLVLKSASYAAPDDVRIGEIQFIVGSRFLITIRHGDATPLADVRTRLERDPELLRAGHGAVIYAVVDAIVDAYGVVIEELELDVDEAEEAVFGDRRANPVGRIFGLKRQVLDLLRNLVPMADVLADLQRADGDLVDPSLDHYFRDVDDHLRRVLSRLEMVRDLLTDALNANLTQVGVRQNDDMRTISAWAAIIAAPTMLAGVWGMNFESMPELSWGFGYPAAIVSMMLAVILLRWRFKRVGWL